MTYHAMPGEKTLLGRLLPNREADAKCLKALMHFGRACAR